MTGPELPLPSRLDALDFWLRTRLLTLWALARELCRPSARRWRAGAALADAPVLAEHRSSLWADGRADEFPLVAGKVHNLRVALPAFQAIEVPAGQTLSFWRQLGRPTAARGFVEGREIRSGCVVPTLAGGLCQLSNSLADAAHRAGFELVERHGHTARPESTAPLVQGLDATVFWRHVDLKLRAPQAWRIELELDATHLTLRLRGERAASSAVRPVTVLPVHAAAPVVRGCLTCGETACFRHRGTQTAAAAQARTAVLVDRWWPELEAAMAGQQVDWIGPRPLRLAFWRSRPSGVAAQGLFWLGLKRALWERLWARQSGGRRQASLMEGQRWVAEAVARRLGPLHTRLVVDQGLLPHLERLGALAGRQIEVWAPALPLAEVQRRLDQAAVRWPEDGSLRDFRAPPALVAEEARALRRVERILTSHHGVAELHARAGVEVVRQPWAGVGVAPSAPPAPPSAQARPLLYFPGPPLGRKGRHELLAALRGQPWRLRARGDWPGCEVEAVPTEDPLGGVAVVVLPAHVEHQPRALLAALARGLRVIATPACGLPPQPGLTLVAEGDVPGLRAALQAALSA